MLSGDGSPALEVDRLRETSIQQRDMVLATAERVAGLGYALWDERTRSYVFVSEQYANFFGVSPDKYFSLLVDDDDLVLTTVTQTLERLGYAVTPARSAEEDRGEWLRGYRSIISIEALSSHGTRTGDPHCARW